MSFCLLQMLNKFEIRARAVCGAFVFFSMIVMMGCSSSEDDTSTSDPVSNNQGANNPNFNQGDSVNGASSNSATNKPKENENFGDGEAVNNSAKNEFASDPSASGSDETLNLSNSALTNPAPTNNAKTLNNTLLPANSATNSAGGVTANATAPANNATASKTAAPATTGAPTGSGIVRYVVSTANVSDQPGGAAVATLEQGDHPVVWEEGDHAKLGDGKYVPKQSLSEKGVGRPRREGSWRSGH